MENSLNNLMQSLGCEPREIDLPSVAPDDLRVGHLLGDANSVDADAIRGAVVLLGFPSDEGVRRNLGRPGAAEGPDAIRHWLYRMTPDPRQDGQMRALLARTYDVGNMRCTGDLSADQARLGEAVAAILSADAFPIVLGGGHEVGFAHFLAHAITYKPVTLFNLDAHLDVRPLREGLGHSGSPFREALEHPSGMAEGYIAVGLEASAVAVSHVMWAKDRGAVLQFLDEMGTARDLGIKAILDAAKGEILGSLDVDVVGAESAPGVSAPRACGISSAQFLNCARQLGKHPRLVGLNIAELSPPFDVDGRTARLCARAVWEVVGGLMEREAEREIAEAG